MRIIYEQQSIEDLEEERERLETALSRISPRSGMLRKYDINKKLTTLNSVLSTKKIEILNNQ